MGQTPGTAQDTLTHALDWACSHTAGSWHDSGNLYPAVLRAIANHATRVGARETAETGCGLSTIVLSVIADCHTCFTLAAGNSLERVQGASHLRRNHVNFVIGPSQLTLPRHSFARPLDFVLIDGPHGFPFAQMEYFHFYQRIRRGGMLVVDDINIPTIRQLYDFLCDDRMWTHVEDVLMTAFFQRSDESMFDPHGDGWYLQQFNQRHLQDSAPLDIACSGWRERMPPPPGPLLGADTTPVPEIAAPAPVADNDSLHAEIAHLRSENAALKSSTSWRLIPHHFGRFASTIRGR
jgi:hypothetical protein